MEEQGSGWYISVGDDNDTDEKSKIKRVKKRSFIKALESKYSQSADVEQLKYCKIVFHGKPKSDEKSELGYLRNVVLTDSNIAVSGLIDRSLRDICPHVVDLDISGNLFDNWKSILTIVSQLDSLKYLNVARNPLKLGKKSLEEWTDVFPSIENLVLNSTEIPWTDVLKLTEIFENLKELHICGNGYSEIPDCDHSGMISVETLRLNDNNLENWDQIWKLKHLPRLKSLILSGNPLQDVYFHDNNPDRQCSRSNFGENVSYNSSIGQTKQQQENGNDNLTEKTYCHDSHGETEINMSDLDLDHEQERLNEGSELYEECRNILELLIFGIHDNQTDTVQGNLDNNQPHEQHEESCGGSNAHRNVNAQNVCDKDKICNHLNNFDSVDALKELAHQTENQNNLRAEVIATGKLEKGINSPEISVEVKNEEKDPNQSNMPQDGTTNTTFEIQVKSSHTKSTPTNQNNTKVEGIKVCELNVTLEDSGIYPASFGETFDNDKEIHTDIPNDGGNDESDQRSNRTNQKHNENDSTIPGNENSDIVNEANTTDDNQKPQPFQNLENICLSETKIGKWKHLTALSAFPALVSIRIKDVKLGARLTQEDRRKLFLPCLPKIKVLNGSEVTTTERDKGERYFLRYFCDKPKKPQIYSTLEKKHGTLTPFVDIDISRGYQEFVTLTFVFEGQEVFKETVSVRQPVGKLRLIIAENLSLYASLKTIKMYHKYCNPEHQTDLLYTGELEQLVLDTLPISRFDIMDGDQIHIDLYDKFTSGAYKYIYVRNYLPKKKEFLDELKFTK